jgi:glyoxylase I family protein
MAELETYQARREELKQRYLTQEDTAPRSVPTSGVDHLALICSDLNATIQFYTQVLGMRLTNIITNRDEPTSTHIFLDMGGGNQLAFFDFPKKGPAKTVRGIGSMHHIALKALPAQFREIVARLKTQQISYSLHGSEESGSVYVRDPDEILVEVTTGY